MENSQRVRVSATVRVVLLVMLTAFAGCNQVNGTFKNQIGRSFYNAGDYANARVEFQGAVADNPFHPDYVYNLASATRKQGDLARAEPLYRRAIALNPSHQPSYHGLTAVLKQQGRHDEALALLRTWADSQPYASGAHIEMAALQRDLGDLAGAEQSLRTALRVQPNHPTALAQLGQVSQDSGRPDRAVALYQRSLWENWNQPHVHQRLASMRSPGRIGLGPAYAYGGPPNQRLAVMNQGMPIPQQVSLGYHPVGMPSAGFPGVAGPMMAGPAHPGPVVSQVGPDVAKNATMWPSQPLPGQQFHVPHMGFAPGNPAMVPQVASRPDIPTPGVISQSPPARIPYPAGGTTFHGATPYFDPLAPANGPLVPIHPTQPGAGENQPAFENADPAHIQP